ncbi:hypothetical protein Val02_64690 [Virgisporangium aliadipatigenens]|uniref:Uncharacterized protein n=1 Tax=Virgisporangium aliadipatigenens TaxID=741659 RepID=A0A8J3YTQ4_9ACTN|nr:hypothetical protein [Virgisporangium aliadipatigenens]GIJ49583.1 hypothetical protein Val02_64690 [Virgisporangium aliadipatigenens]
MARIGNGRRRSVIGEAGDYQPAGAGRSSRLAPSEYTVARHVADLDAIRQKLAAPKVVLMDDGRWSINASTGDIRRSSPAHNLRTAPVLGDADAAAEPQRSEASGAQRCGWELRSHARRTRDMGDTENRCRGASVSSGFDAERQVSGGTLDIAASAPGWNGTEPHGTPPLKESADILHGRNVLLLRRIFVGGMALAAAVSTLTACGERGSESGGALGASPSAVRPKQLFADNFEPVCDGKPFPFAKAYDAAATGHKAVLFRTYRDGAWVDGSSGLPADWTVKFEAGGDAYAAVDVTVCLKRTAATFVKECRGYEVNGKPDALVVKMHSATWVMSVHEAQTGKELASKEVAATDTTCTRYVVGAPKDATTLDEFAKVPDEDVVAFAKPFVQP